MRKATSTKTTPYDVATYLNGPEEMAAYLDAWLTEAPDDVAGITRALEDIARAKGHPTSQRPPDTRVRPVP
jgi:DNA-binding phage protein